MERNPWQERVNMNAANNKADEMIAAWKDVSWNLAKALQWARNAYDKLSPWASPAEITSKLRGQIEETKWEQ